MNTNREPRRVVCPLHPLDILSIAAGASNRNPANNPRVFLAHGFPPGWPTLERGQNPVGTPIIRPLRP